MKHIATVVVMLCLGVAAVYAQENHVKMTFSGTAASSTVNLAQPDTSNDEDNFTGNGTLGSFTVRNVRAVNNNPSSPPSTCSGANLYYFTEPAGGGVFRFQDGSLLNVNLTQGSDCINFATNEAHCTVTFQITGGTGRFQNASGTLTFTETVVTVLSDALGNPVFFAATGEYTGTISGVSGREEPDEGQ